MIQAVVTAGSLAKTIEAEARFAGVDGQAKRTRSPEVQLFEISAAGRHRTGGCGLVGVRGTDLPRQQNLDHVTDVAALDQSQNTFLHQATHGLSNASGGNAHIVGQPHNRKAQAELSFVAAVPEQMRVDRAVEDGEFEPRREDVFEFFTHLYSVEFCSFHRVVLLKSSGEWRVTSDENRK
jgi:hypothetical protein